MNKLPVAFSRKNEKIHQLSLYFGKGKQNLTGAKCKMTSPIIVEEEDSVLVSSSGSSPVLLTDPDSDYLEVLPTSPNSHFSHR